jgi:hypothetical protein
MKSHMYLCTLQGVTVDMMDTLIGYDLPVKFLEVDEVGRSTLAACGG